MKRIGIIAAGLLTVLCSFSVSTPVQAASNSLGVNPRRDYTVKAGNKVTDTLVLTNLSKTDDLTVQIKPTDFGPQDETGSPSLMLKATEPTKWSLNRYLTIPESYKVPAGKSVDVPFTISIPANVGAGSFYSAIRYSAVADGTNKNISLTSSSATLMFVRVPGEARSFMQLQKFGAFVPSEDGKTGAFTKVFGSTSPKYLSYRLKNTGNVAEQPTGSLLIKNIFGKQVKLYENANPRSNIVLIDQTRRIDLCLNEERTTKKDELDRTVEDIKCNEYKFAPGRYTAQLSLLYGNEGGSSNELSGSTTFWYLPAWFVVSVVAALAVIAGLIWFVIRTIKNRGKSTYRRR
jgi:hypothetical protein